MLLNQKITIELSQDQSEEFLRTLKFLKGFAESYEPPPSSSKRYLNIEETSKYTGISVDTLYQYTSQRKIPFIKPGKHLIFDAKQIDIWLEQYRKETL